MFGRWFAGKRFKNKTNKPVGWPQAEWQGTKDQLLVLQIPMLNKAYFSIKKL